MERQFTLTYDPDLELGPELFNDYSAIDDWGVLECISEVDGVGVEYNLCIDSDTDESAFYPMYYNPETDYWETDYTSPMPYQIDFDDPNWKVDFEAQAQAYLNQLLDNY